VLPGGDVPYAAFDDWAAEVAAREYPFLNASQVVRLCRAYGSRIRMILEGVDKPADLGRDFGAGLSEREVEYLVAQEWAETGQDILWRRSKLGLRLSEDQRDALDAYLIGARAPVLKAAAGGVQP